MTKAKPYETVRLRQAVDGFRAGEVGAVVEVYTSPFEAYDVELVDNNGHTTGLLEGVRPEQIEVIRKPDLGRVVTSVAGASR